MRVSRKVAVMAFAGLAAAWLLALGFGDTPLAATEVVALAAGPAVAFALAGAAAMRRLGSCSLSTYLSVAVLTTVLGVASGTILAGWRMFLSTSDVKIVIVVLLAAGTIGALTAIVLATGLRDAVTGVGRLAASIGQRPLPPDPGCAIPTAELSRLAGTLQEIGEHLHESMLRERTLESSRRELVAWISHDLRTPLAGIQALAEALEDGVVDDPETVRRYYRTMKSEVDRLSGMVDDLFRLSRIHSGLIDLHIEIVSLEDLVSDAMALMKPMAEAKGVRLTGNVDCRESYVPLSTTEFLRTLRNLLDNAVRHTPPGGEVSVHAASSAVEAIVEVRDGCGGIPESDIDRIFELGYQGDSARTPASGKRAGLGLAIAQGLVSAHGGDIEVANETQGCCFTVRLPVPASS